MGPQQTIAHYRITSKLGEGGMGEVWRATDTKLGRDVALKILPASFARDPARMARFEREAKALASLNHPHIAQIYGVEEGALVMELVEGEPLKGPLPVEKAVEYAGQILDALDAAHKKGIVHRDLKPANILVTRQGIKLLDFGLAKLADAPIAGPEETVTQGLTQQGQILGTLQYMSPEQLIGKDVDSRSDLFSFGCVLYEMLSGKRAFDGKSAASVIAAILEREPAPLNLAPPLERVVRWCLAKDPGQRFQTACDLKTALIWASEQPATGKTPRRGWIAASVAALALGVLGGGWGVSQFRQPAAAERVLRLQINPPPGGQFVLGGAGGLSISPDGKIAAYIALVNGKAGLWVRPLDGVAARLLPGTDNAIFPFWSPDSKSIAFVAGITSLARVDVRGGAPVAICDSGQIITGGSWGGDGYILFSTLASSIFRVSASGGTPLRVITPDASRGETFFRWPEALPGERFLYWVESNKPENNGVYAASFARPGERVKLLSGETNALYAPGVEGKGHLLWLRGGTLLAQEFDPQSLQFAGESQPIVEALNPSPRRQMHVAVSNNGLLLYGSSGTIVQLGWFDRNGKLLRPIGEPVETILTFRLSPDERQIAMHRSTAGIWDLWLMDAERGLASRFTSGTGYHHPLWSPDGHVILYSNIGSKSVLRKAANGAGDEQVVARNHASLDDWSDDGRWVLARTMDVDVNTKSDLWMLPMTSDGKMREAEAPKPYLRTPFNELNGRFQPGPGPRWVAYQSDESGRDEIYIDSFPQPRGKKRISTGGGRFPEWGTGGRELFYLSPEDKLMAVRLKLEADTVEPSMPRELFRLPVSSIDFSGHYEVSRDGQRFLVLTNPEARPQALTLIVNWQALLKRGAAAP